MAFDILKENGYFQDRNDPKWAHPEYSDNWGVCWSDANFLFDPEVTREERLRRYKEEYLPGLLSMVTTPEKEDTLEDVMEYEVPGCPEEPDVKAKVTVVIPRTKKKKKNTIFFVVGGGLYMVSKKSFDIVQISRLYNSIVVCVEYRNCFEGRYPIAVNDLHAGYQWMIDNAEELGVNKDKIAIYGQSSGGHLALALTFRLKRYNWCGGEMPRGVLATVPILEDRPNYPSMQIIHNGWGGFQNARSNREWLGVNSGNPFIGPEAYPNRATIEDCKGLPPVFIETGDCDAQRDPSMAFMEKVYAANVYGEIHTWGGADHGSFCLDLDTEGETSCPRNERIRTVHQGYMKELFKYDFRRQWLYETKE